MKPANSYQVPEWGPRTTNVGKVRQLQKNSQKNNLLRAAIRNNNIREFRELGELSEKDITTKDNRGYTLLHEAALAKSVDFLIEILPKERTCTNVLMCRPKKIINVNVQENDGNTPLMLAIIDNYYMSKESIINELLSFGADSSKIENKYGQTAKDIYNIVLHKVETDWNKYKNRLGKSARRSYYLPDDHDADRSPENFVLNSNNAPPEEQPVPLGVIQKRIDEAAASARRKRVAAMKPVVPEIAPPPPLPSPSTARPPPLVVGGRKKTTRNNKGHTNVSRRWRRAPHILRSSRVAARKTGRRASRRTRRRHTTFFA